MATNIPTECSICTQEYNEGERCPRILPCFHTLCSSCILDIIRAGDKKCPFCIQNFVRERITDFRINVNALEKLKYIKDIQSKVSKSRNRTGRSSFEEIDALKQEMSKLNAKNSEVCFKAQEQLKAFIIKNNEQKDVFKRANKMIQEEVIPKAIITVSRNNKQVLRLEKENERLEDQLDILKARQHKLDEAHKRINYTSTFRSTGSLMDEAKIMDSQLRENSQELELLVENNEKLQQEINKTCKALKARMSTMIEMLRGWELELGNSRDEVLDPFLYIDARTIQETITDHIATLGGRNGKMKQLIELGMVYAKQEHEGKIRYAALSISNKKYLCIHHLQDKPVALNAVTLQFEAAMRLVNPVSRLSFIELKSITNGKVLGKLMIRLTHDTKQTNYFQLLCTGQEGPSYSDTTILQVLNKRTTDECILMGDCETGSGLKKSLLDSEAVGDREGLLNQPWKAGVVTTSYFEEEAKRSQFQIYTQDKPGSTLENSCGFVEEGLQMLTDAIKRYSAKRKVKISDCGMVLRTL